MDLIFGFIVTCLATSYLAFVFNISQLPYLSDFREWFIEKNKNSKYRFLFICTGCISFWLSFPIIFLVFKEITWYGAIVYAFASGMVGWLLNSLGLFLSSGKYWFDVQTKYKELEFKRINRDAPIK